MLKKEEKQQLLRVYKKMDGLADYNHAKHGKDVVRLHQVATQFDLLKTLTPGTVYYEKTYSQLLRLAYEYYQVTGEVPKELLPNDVTLATLVESYYQVRKDVFNVAVQNQVHNYLRNTVPLLRQLQHTAQVGPTIDEYADIRLGFQEQLRFLLSHGFALDLQIYEQRIESVWLMVKVARQLTANDFKPLVKVLDWYSRLETGNEDKVLYHADAAHTTKEESTPASLTPEEQQRQDQERERQKSRLGIHDEKDGSMVVRLPNS